MSIVALELFLFSIEKWHIFGPSLDYISMQLFLSPVSDSGWMDYKEQLCRLRPIHYTGRTPESKQWPVWSSKPAPFAPSQGHATAHRQNWKHNARRLVRSAGWFSVLSTTRKFHLLSLRQLPICDPMIPLFCLMEPGREPPRSPQTPSWQSHAAGIARDVRQRITHSLVR